MKPEPPEDLWQQLEKVAGTPLIDQRPPNSFTIDEFARRYKISRSTASQRLTDLVNAGKLVRTHIVTEVNGKRCNVWMYAIKNSE